MKLNKFNKEELTSLYFENKDYLLPVFAIIISFFLFFIFIVPQVLSFPSRKQAVDVENDKLNKIKESEIILSTANKDLIDSQLKTAAKALPSNKEFENILNGISTAATLSESRIDGYEFQAADSMSTEPQKFSSLLFKVTIIGNIKQAIKFVNQIHKAYPISEVIDINNTVNTSVLSILFYYKSFPSLGTSDRTQIRNMSVKEKAVLDEISKWSDTNSNASASASNNSSPF